MIDRDDPLYVHSIPLDAGDRHVGLYWPRHCVLRVRHGPQRLRVAESKFVLKMHICFFARGFPSSPSFLRSSSSSFSVFSSFSRARRPNGVRIPSIITHDIYGSPRRSAGSPLYFLAFHEGRARDASLLLPFPSPSLRSTRCALNLSPPRLISISRNGRCHYHAIIYVGDHSTM